MSFENSQRGFAIGKGGHKCVSKGGCFSRRCYLFSDHRATAPSAPPLARLSAVSDCDNVARGCHATPPTLSLCAVEAIQVYAAPSNKQTHLPTSISEYTPAHSTVSHFPTNFRLPVFYYWEKTELGLLAVGHRFVNPNLQSSRNTVRRPFLCSRVGTRTLTFEKSFFRRSISFPNAILLSIRCWATRF